jgi:hypothetical protein
MCLGTPIYDISAFCNIYDALFASLVCIILNIPKLLKGLNEGNRVNGLCIFMRHNRKVAFLITYFLVKLENHTDHDVLL